MRLAFLAMVIFGLGAVIFGEPTRTGAAGDRSISGVVFLDTDRDGQRDTDESPAPGRTVQLSRFNGTAWRRVDEVKSDNEGRYHFDRVPSNTSLMLGVWTDEQTECGTGHMHEYDVQEGRALIGTSVSPGARKDLGVLPIGDGVITGTLTNDLNENGVRDADEPPLKGWKVALPGSSTTKPFTVCYSEQTTGPQGDFQFAVNLDLWYILRLDPPASAAGPWEWTAPTLPHFSGDLPDSRRAADSPQEGDRLDVMIHLARGTAAVAGTAFLDLDADGVRDAPEPFLDCSVIEIGALQLSRRVADIGVLDVQAKPTCTNGDFKFTGLEAGTFHLGIPGYISLPDEGDFGPWPGQWVTLARGQHIESVTIALCPAGKCDRPPATPAPMPITAAYPEKIGVIMPVVGGDTQESNRVSTAALVLVAVGAASTSIAILLRSCRPRRDSRQNRSQPVR